MARPKSLSHLSEEATQQTNTANVLTPILEIVPEDNTMLTLMNMVAKGTEQGLPMFAKLRSGASTELPTDTKVLFRVERPTDDEPTAVSVGLDNISAYNELTTAEQRNLENIDAVKVPLKGAAVNVRYKDTLTIEVNSSAQIDWNNSELYFYQKGVFEQPIEG